MTTSDITQQDPTSILLGNVAVITKDMTDEELAVCYLAATSGWAIEPITIGYEKFKPLLTQENGTKMHPITVTVLGSIVSARLEGTHDN